MTAPSIQAGSYASKQSTNGAGLNMDFSVTVGAGDSNTKLIVFVAARTNNSTIPNFDTCTYGGVSMTRVAHDEVNESTSYTHIARFELLNPAVGTATVHPHMSVVGSAHAACAFVVKDCKQQLSDGDGVYSGGNPAGRTIAVQTAVDGTDLPTVAMTPVENDCLLIFAGTVNVAQAITVKGGTNGAMAGASITCSTTITLGAADYALATAASFAGALTAAGTYGRSNVLQSYEQPVPADFITATELAANSFYQRTGTSAGVAVSGTYGSTAPTTIEGQVTFKVGGAVQLAWVALTGVSIAGGVWSGTIPGVPQGGEYNFQVRGKDGGGTVLFSSAITSNGFLVGKRFMAFGASVNDRMFTQGTAVAQTLLKKLEGSAATGPAGSGVYAASNTVGSGVGKVGEVELAREATIPVCLVNASKSGSRLGGAGNWADNTGTLWNDILLPTIAEAEVTNAGWEGCFFNGGGNDATAGTIVSKAAHLTNLRTLVTNTRAVLTNKSGEAQLPIFFSSTSRNETGDPNEAQYALLRPAEADFSFDTGIYFCSIVDLAVNPADGIHLVSNPDMETRSRRLLASRTNSRRGPRLTSVVSYDAGTKTAILGWTGQGPGLVTVDGVTTGITGLSCLDGADAAVTVSSHEIIGAWRTRAVLATGPAVAKFGYLQGMNPDVSHILYDASSAIP